MAMELLAARMLMPVFGMGVDVWAAVIAATLGFLAVGSAAGGYLADKRPGPGLLASILIFASCSMLAIGLAGRQIVDSLADLSQTAGACCAAALLLAVPMALFGTVVPILVRIVAFQTTRTGRVVGTLLALSTVGGIVGTLATSLILTPQFGVSATLLVLTTITAVLGVLVLVAARKRAVAATVIVAVAAVSLLPHPGASVGDEAGSYRILAEVEGHYGRYAVVEDDNTRTLLCNGITQTALPLSAAGMRPGTLIRGRDFTELIPYLRPGCHRVLLLGLGGALHERMLMLYGMEVHAVEIEPAVVRLAAEYFGFSSEVTIGDGRAFLTRDRSSFDAIILDTFIGSLPPEHLYTREAFSQMAARLGHDGVLAVHLIAPPSHPAVLAIGRTIQEVFPNLLGARSGLFDEWQHLYLFTSRGELRFTTDQRRQLDEIGFDEQGLFEVRTDGSWVLTDDCTNLAVLSRELAIGQRRFRRQSGRTSRWQEQ